MSRLACAAAGQWPVAAGGKLANSLLALVVKLNSESRHGQTLESEATRQQAKLDTMSRPETSWRIQFEAQQREWWPLVVSGAGQENKTQAN